jgi:hypothetical protein
MGCSSRLSSATFAELLPEVTVIIRVAHNSNYKQCLPIQGPPYHQAVFAPADVENFDVAISRITFDGVLLLGILDWFARTLCPHRTGVDGE